MASRDPFVLRRCQIILASAQGEHAIPLGRLLGCTDETVRNVIKDLKMTSEAGALRFATAREGARQPALALIQATGQSTTS